MEQFGASSSCATTYSLEEETNTQLPSADFGGAVHSPVQLSSDPLLQGDKTVLLYAGSFMGYPEST